jgi:glycosyltransferase involved in cell wall biosynthesis
VQELVGDCGRLADVDDSAALAREVSQLLADPVLASRLGQAARRRVVPVFGKDRLVDDIDGLYRRLLTRGFPVTS